MLQAAAIALLLAASTGSIARHDWEWAAAFAALAAITYLAFSGEPLPIK